MKEFIDKTTENLEEKIKVTSLEIIVTGTKDKPYFEIKYREVGKEDYSIGYSSYDLNYVFAWKEECFEIVNELAEEYKGGWIPCERELPKIGLDVLCFTEGGYIVIAQWGGEESSYLDEKAVWFLRRGWCRKNHIVAWMPLPAPYTEGEAELYRAKSVDGEYQEYKGDWK